MTEHPPDPGPGDRLDPVDAADSLNPAESGQRSEPGDAPLPGGAPATPVRFKPGGRGAGITTPNGTSRADASGPS